MIASGVGWADERLPEIVVTAPGIEESPAPRDPTSFSTVIQTREAPATVETLAEALSDTVGVQVRQFGGLGDFSTVSVRGFSPGQVQVYLDGVPLTRAENETVNLSDLPLDAVDHVEVYRSVTPIAFAQSSPGGVINVVTRRPTEQPLAGASVSYGSFETRKASLAYGQASGAWDGLVFAQYLGSQGDFTFTNESRPADPTVPREQTRINNAFDQGDLTTRLDYRDGPYTLAFTTDTFAKSQGVPGRSTVQSTTGHRDVVRTLGQVDLAVVPPDVPFRIDASVFGFHQDQTFTAEADLAFPTTDVTDRTTAAGAQVLARGALGAHQLPALLLAGSGESFVDENGVGQFGVVLPGTSPPRSRARFTVAGEDEILLFDERVSILPGVRWEYYRDDFPGDPRLLVPALGLAGTFTHDFVTPRVGVRGDVGWGVTLLGNASRSARVPNLSELFGNSGVVRANQLHPVQPETAVNWDIGGRSRLPTGGVVTAATVECAYFSSDVDDLITLVPSSQSIFVPTNIGAATIRGEEVSLRTAFRDRLLVTTNYTHQDARDAGAEAFAHGKRIPGRPADEAYVRVELVWSPARPLPIGPAGASLWPGRVYFDVNLIGDNFLDRANRQRVPSRSLLGTGIDVALPVAGLHLAFEAKNLTDDQTEDALGFPLPGRSFFATLSYGFTGSNAQK